MSDRTEVSFTTVVEFWRNGKTIDPDDTAEGHVLTVEHLGSNPERDVLGEFDEVLETVLGEPDNFDEFEISIGPNETVVTRTDVPVHQFGTKQDMEVEAASSLRPHDERQVFTTAATDMSASINDVADELGVSPGFVGETLGDI